MDTSEDPDDRDLRCWQLAKRLVSHHARTQTIYAFTGYSRHRLAKLRTRWRVAPEERHRGPSPTSFSVFFKSPRARHVATAAAVICKLLGATRAAPGARMSRRIVDLDFGEHVCEVHEALQACFPDVELEFEQVMLLAVGLSRHESIDLTSCAKCGIAVLADQFSIRRRTCFSCHRPPAPAIGTSDAPGRLTTDAAQDQLDASVQQPTDHSL
jgi:hypothetical protein